MAGGQPMMREKISIIGAGHMGGALVKGFVTKGKISPENILASDPERKKLEELGKKHSIRWTQDNKEAVCWGDIVILAVVPKYEVLYKVLREISQVWTDPDKLLVSIAAGIKCKDIEWVLNKKTKIVRVMPNGPAEIGEGATALFKGTYASDKDVERVEEIFKTIGETLIIEEEKKMNAVTGLSGSGPAYVFWFIKALIEAGTEAGLSEEQSNSLAKQTTLGAAQIVKHIKKTPDELIEMIATHGGTTKAALSILEEKSNLYKILINAVKEARDRSKEIGEKFHQQVKEGKK